MKRQQGFTIIELVVVIALLGILAAVALPRFINVTDDAHNAAVKGAAGGLASGVALVKAQAVVAASGATVSIDGITINLTSNNYPEATNAAGCVTVWDSVLAGSRPVAATATGTGVDYVATYSDPNCTYTYREQNSGSDRTIVYNKNNGNVSTTNVD